MKVRLEFERAYNQGSSGIAHFYVDQISIEKYDRIIILYCNWWNRLIIFISAAPVNLPFVCSFDEYIDVTTNACGGLSYVATNLATFAGLELDLLPGTTSTYITDYTSIGSYIPWIILINIFF